MINNLNNLLRKHLLLYVIIFCNIIFSQSANDKFTVVLDAGHGGKDPGNTGNGYYEKNIALSIALQIGAILEKKNNIKVIYTRKKDVFVNLFKRAEIANKAKADLFISIHCDAHNSNAYGAGTFVLGLHANQRNFEIAKKENSVIFQEDNYEQKYGGFDPNNPESVISLVLMQEEYLDQSIKAANLIQDFFTKNLKRKNRNVKQAGFIVLKYTYMPSVLVETGFLTNKNEGKYLNSKRGQKEMSNTIADAISSIKTNDQKYLMGFCFPGLKTPKLDGITVMSNGPRNIKMLSKINDKINSKQKHKPLIKQIYNDSECCLIGEWKSSIGKLKNCENAIYLGGGTGIADGIILNNKIIDFMSSKILKQSWQLIMPSGQSVENCLSLGGMLNQWNKGKSIEALNSLFENATKGDIHANQIIDNASEAFIFLIKKRMVFFKSHNTNPEKIVIGQRLGEILSDENNPLSKSIFQNNFNVTIELSNNRNTAALGAAYKVYDLYK